MFCFHFNWSKISFFNFSCITHIDYLEDCHLISICLKLLNCILKHFFNIVSDSWFNLVVIREHVFYFNAFQFIFLLVLFIFISVHWKECVYSVFLGGVFYKNLVNLVGVFLLGLPGGTSGTEQMRLWSLDGEDPEEVMAIHLCILA